MDQWTRENKSFAVARVIQTWGSSPRPIGSALIISEDMEMAGSVSGGCVEGAVLKEAKQIIKDKTAKTLSYGVSDDEAWSVGLTCGGRIQVYLQAWPVVGSPEAKEWNLLRQYVNDGKGCVLITELIDGSGGSTLLTEEGTHGSSLPEEVKSKAHEAYLHRAHSSITWGDSQYFIHVFPPKSRLLIIGAAHITADLVQLAKLYDFETIVIDPRGAFANRTQFPVAPDRIMEKYPSEVLNDLRLDVYTYAVILSHDPKIDDNALQILLRSSVAYIGALGSRKTHEKRITRLTQAGFSDEELKRIESPIGMDIHALGAREIALSIMGSIIKAKNLFV